MSARRHIFFAGLFVLLLAGGLFLAKQEDPFCRTNFTLHPTEGTAARGTMVSPKPFSHRPWVIYLHATGALEDGNDLRQMAQLGLTTVTVDYTASPAQFDSIFAVLLQYQRAQEPGHTISTAWVGFNAGANLMFDYAVRHSDDEPQLFVYLNGEGNTRGQTNRLFGPLRCPVLRVNDDGQDQQEKKNGLPFKLRRGAIFQNIGEQCLTILAGTNAWLNYHSVAQWQEDHPASLWLCLLPAFLWMVAWALAMRRKQLELSRNEIALRVLAALVTVWAFALTAIHLGIPQLKVDAWTLKAARNHLVLPKERDDFEYLAAQPIWSGQRLKVLLEHLELANYIRELKHWKMDDATQREFVLSPVITGAVGEPFNWRRDLWEAIYPRVRRTGSVEDAAKIVATQLRQRITIRDLPNPPRDVPSIWLRQITDEAGFEIIQVAGLRSIGIPARLDKEGHAEFWDGAKWQSCPSEISRFR